MIARNSRWWPRIATFGILVCDGLVPLRSFAEDGGPRIGVVSDPQQRPILFEAVGFPASELRSLKSLPPFDAAFPDVFAVYVVDPSHDPDFQSVPPISGNYVVEEKRLTFIPRHPLRPGLTYRAVLRRPDKATAESSVSGSTTIEREVAVPPSERKSVAPAVVENVYPTARELPENHLRFYLHFSKPMSRGNAYELLEVLDESGTAIEAPFLEIGEELWDPHGQRLTLLLDPGRVKQGLKPREEFGPVLEVGKKYALRIKPGWRNAEGEPLTNGYLKEFSVGPAVHEAIDLRQWRVALPDAATREPIVVESPRSLDHALFQRAIRVVDADGETVQGQIEVTRNERSWKFVPNVSWNGAIYQLLIDANLEDSSGNSIRRPFEVDNVKPITPTIERDVIRFPFQISKPESVAPAKARAQRIEGTTL